ATGSFIVIDRLTNVTIGAGMIESPADTVDSLEPVEPAERERRLAQRPAIISCSGNQASTLAVAVERALFDQGKTVVVLSDKDTDTASTLKTARLLTDYGLIAIAINLGSEVASAS